MTGKIVCKSRQVRSALLPEPLFLRVAAENLGKSLRDEKKPKYVNVCTPVCSRRSVVATHRSRFRPKHPCQ
jgi:hypothetical protein